MSVPHARGFLLLRRAGGVWGIANAAIDGLSRTAEGYTIAVGAGTLVADEILGVVDDLRVRPAAPAMRRFWPEASAGVAVHGGWPVVVVDPGHPPAALFLAGKLDAEFAEVFDEGEEGDHAGRG
ncbi:MAG TPA: hypothetical protein VGH73_02950 [Thermoanaerobaculia bacterium]